MTIIDKLTMQITDQNMRLSQQIARALYQREVDTNEVHKALQFLVAQESGSEFFTFLQILQRSGSIVVRSNRTLDYYATIYQVCQQYLRAYQDDAKRMAYILGWAIRLMPFYRLEPHLPQTQSLLSITPSPAASQPMLSTIGQKPTQLSDLYLGLELTGHIVKLAPFGAFVDISIGQHGLVHVSKLREGFVHKPDDVVQIGDTVTVWVDQIDLEKKRIGLTMIEPTSSQQKAPTRAASKPASAPLSPSTAVNSLDSGAISPEPEKVIKSAPIPRPAAIQVSSLEQVVPALWLKGIIRKVDTNRLIVDIGIPIEASIAFAQLEGQPKDPDEVAAILPAGTEIEARVLGINQRGRLQLTLKP